jgi:hypothetical protein
MKNSSNKTAIVLDLDETLGYYTQFGVFMQSVLSHVDSEQNSMITQTLFNRCLDLYPEFMRPHIIEILTYIKENKIIGKCNKVLIYTNNKGPREWGKSIIAYIENKLNYHLFDQIIGAFKINGEQVELDRTSPSKSYADIISCSKIPENTQICFIDDSYFPEMVNKNVYYIKIEPYVHTIPYPIMIKRLLSSDVFSALNISMNINEFSRKLAENMQIHGFRAVDLPPHVRSKDYMVHTDIAKHIIKLLGEFFSKHSMRVKHTKKYNRWRTQCRTRKKKRLLCMNDLC